MKKIILALYDTLPQAENAVNDLQNAGFERSRIGLAVSQSETSSENKDVSADEGAGFGAVVGGLTGALAGLVAITIPGIGPIIAAGPLAAALGSLTGAAIGAVAGAVTGGITASLVELGVSEEYANYYAESVRRGSALVSVTAEENQIATATAILQRHHPYNLDERVFQWKKEGWSGFDPKAEPFTAVEGKKVRSDLAQDDLPYPSERTTEDIEEQVEMARIRMFPHRPIM